MATLLYTTILALLLGGLLFAAWRVHLSRTAEHHGETMAYIARLRDRADEDRYRRLVEGRHRLAEVTAQIPAVPRHDGFGSFVPWEEVKAKRAALQARREQEIG